MKRFSRSGWLGLLFAALPALASAADWREQLTPKRGDFPPLPAVEMSVRFGWSNLLEAATAQATLKPDGPGYRASVRGGTLGFARALWPLDAQHAAYLPGTQEGARYDQTERYRSRTIETSVRFDATGLKRRRQTSNDPDAARWKRLDFVPLFDVIGGGLFVRSQPLRNGDTVGLVCYPGDSPYFVTLRVERREKLRVMGKEWPAIRMALNLRRLEVRNHRPEADVNYGKFRSGTVWLSDDDRRIPLRAEVTIMVGFIYAELSDLKWK